MRRDSVEAGTFEDLFFAAPAKGETDRLLRAARAALDAGRRLKREARAEGRELSAIERAVAGLTAGAVRVYEELLTLARLNQDASIPATTISPRRPRLAARAEAREWAGEIATWRG